MKNLIIQHYKLSPQYDNKEFIKIAEHIIEIKENNKKKKIAVIISSSDEITNENKKYISDVSKKIGNISLKIITASSKLISAAILTAALKKQRVNADLIDCSTVNINYTKKKITDKIKSLISSNLKKKIDKNHISILFSNNFKIKKKNIPSYFDNSEFFAITIASYLANSTLNFYINKSLFSKSYPDNLLAQKTIFSHNEFLEMTVNKKYNIVPSEFFHYAKNNKVELSFYDISSGKKLITVKNQLLFKGTSFIKQTGISNIIEQNLIARITLTFKKKDPDTIAQFLHKLSEANIEATHLKYSTFNKSSKSFSFIIEQKYLETTLMILDYQKDNLLFTKIIHDTHVSVLNIIGDSNGKNSEKLFQIDKILRENKIKYEFLVTSSIKTSLLLERDDYKKALKILQNIF